MASGGPFPNAIYGGFPDNSTDVAVSGVYIGIYAILAYIHQTIYKRNNQVGHFFLFSILTFGFCMSRIVAFVFRIVWAKNPESVSMAVAANVFVAAGVTLLFVINMNYAQRVVRGLHPRFNDSKPYYYIFLAYYASLIAVLIMIIATTVQSFYTTNISTLETDMRVRKFGSVWNLIFVFAPIPIVLIAKFTSSNERNFGKKGSLQTKIIIVLAVAVLLTISTAIRVAPVFAPPRPVSNPYWYETRASFYVFLGVFEFCVVIIYAVTRVDQRFFVPGKAEKAQAEAEKVPSLTAAGVPNTNPN